MYGRVVTAYSSLLTSRGWDLKFSIPVSIEEHEVSKDDVTFFFQKPCKRIVGYDYYLVFDKEIPESELNFWRGMLVGMKVARPQRY